MDEISGVDVSNPARLSVFLSVGSTMVKQFPVIPMTIAISIATADCCCCDSWRCWLLLLLVLRILNPFL
jgi:hypothetical protein